VAESRLTGGSRATGGSRLTPEYLQSIQFPMARLGKRGVDEEHVRAFCEWVEGELIRLLNEKTALEQEVWRLRERVRETSAGTDDAQNEALSILLRAKQRAEKYLANAQEYSRDLAEDARRRREEIVSEAKLHASVIVDEAHAISIVPAARPGDGGGGDRGGGDRGDGDRGDGGDGGGGGTANLDVAAELADLRTVSQACRSHLRAHLETLARSIDEWENAEQQVAQKPM
jgi:cell division septum initiation protein DivIVA